MSLRLFFMALCIMYIMPVLQADQSKEVIVEKEKITLNGVSYDIGLVRAVVVSMGFFNKIICKELYQKAANPDHKLYAIIAKVLNEHELLDKKGNLKENVAEIVKEYVKRRKDIGTLDFIRSGGNPFELEKE